MQSEIKKKPLKSGSRCKLELVEMAAGVRMVMRKVGEEEGKILQELGGQFADQQSLSVKREQPDMTEGREIQNDQ